LFRAIAAGEGPKDVIDGMEKQAPYSAAVVDVVGNVQGSLGGANEIVHVHIGVCQRMGWIWEVWITRHRKGVA
jgi:hypothetical protein